MVVDLDNPLQPASRRRLARRYWTSRAASRCSSGTRSSSIAGPQGARHHRAGGAGHRAGRACRCGREEHLPREDLRLCRRRTQGLVIVDIERPEAPKLDQVFDAGGASRHARREGRHDQRQPVRLHRRRAQRPAGRAAVLAGTTRTLWVQPEADAVARRDLPDRRPGAGGLRGHRSRSRGGRVGNQLAVFGRRGARPLNRDEQQRLYLRDGRLYTVSTTPPQPATPASLLDTLIRLAAVAWDDDWDLEVSEGTRCRQV